MMCYRDWTYCSVDIYCATQDCDRRMTPEVIRDADRIGLPIATADFRPLCQRFVAARPASPEETPDAAGRRNGGGR